MSEIILYSNITGEMIQELKIEDANPFKPVSISFFEYDNGGFVNDVYIVIVHHQIEVFRVVSFFLDSELQNLTYRVLTQTVVFVQDDHF